MARKKQFRMKKVSVENSYNLTELIENFYLFKQAQGVSERTLEDYRRTFKEFDYFIMEDMSLEDIELAILKYMKNFSTLAPASYNRPYSNLNALFNWIVFREYMPSNPLKNTGLKKRKDPGKLRHHDKEVISKLISVIPKNTYAGIRDYAIVMLTLDTGIRPSEVYGLKHGDVDFRNKHVIIRKEVAKTGVPRQLPLSPHVVNAIKNLCKISPFEPYIFTSSEGNPLNYNSWGKRLLFYSSLIGVNVSSYELRHTFAIMFLRNGGNVFALQYFLGHSDLSMTKRYIHLVKTDIIEAHSKSPAKQFVGKQRLRKI